MLVVVGYLIVIGSVFGGFALAGGHISGLLQPVELLMIAGAAFGAFCVGNPPKTLKATLKALGPMLKSPKYNKALYMQLMALLYEVLTKVRKEGLMSIERDIEAVGESALFAKYPDIVADHHLVEFLTDYLRLIVSGNTSANPFSASRRADCDPAAMPGKRPRSCSGVCPASGTITALATGADFCSTSNPVPHKPSNTGQRTCKTRYREVSATSAGFASSPYCSIAAGRRGSTAPMIVRNLTRFGSTDFA